MHPACRGRGVGRALLARVEAEVQARDGRLLVIETSGAPPYAVTRRFYEACGYRLEATVHDFYAPGDDLVIFRKELLPYSEAMATALPQSVSPPASEEAARVLPPARE